MLRFLPFLALVALAPEAAAMRWTHVCAVPPWDATATYALTSSTPADGCLWTMADGSTVQALPDEIDLFLRDIDAVTEWMRTQGYREPALSKANDRFVVYIAPPGVEWCTEAGCRQPLQDVRLVPVDPETTDVVFLAVPSDKLLTDLNAYELLMRAAQFSYEAFNTSDPNAPASWASAGLAAGFARWWIGRKTGRSPRITDLTRFGRPLLTHDAISEFREGGLTGHFWETVAGSISRETGATWDDPAGFAFAHAIYEELNGATFPIEAADAVLSRPAYGLLQRGTFGRHPATSALSIEFQMFAANYRWWEMAEPLAPMTVPAGETVTREVTHEPFSIVRIPVEIPDADPQTVVTVRVLGASPSISYQYGNREGVGLTILRVGPEGDAEWASSPSQQASPYCPEAGPCAFTIALTNTHPDEAKETNQASYRVEVEVHEVCQLPGGVEGLTYIMQGPDPQTGQRQQLLEIDYDFSRSERGRGLTPNEISGRISMLAGPIPVETGFQGRVVCDEGLFAIVGLEFDHPMLSVIAEPAGAAQRGNRLQLPARASVGSRVPDVVGDAEVGIGREAAVSGGSWLHDLTITGRETRRIAGLDQPVRVWKIEGLSSGDVGFSGEAMVRAMESMGAPLDDEARAEIVARFDAEGGSETNHPVTIYYSPQWGAVETVSGAGAKATVTTLTRVHRAE